MRILAGCPVKNREWVLPAYLDHLFAAFHEVGVEPEFLFVSGSHGDGKLLSQELVGSKWTVLHTLEKPGRRRSPWTKERYHEMVAVRNLLLTHVRALKPDYFLSIDSDILLPQGLLPNLLDSVGDYWAVGGKCYMTRPPSERYPSYGMLTKQGNIRRSAADGVMPVDAIMALKLMTPAAYNVDYVFNPNGEDVGWSRNVKAAGGQLLWDGRIAAKHVLNPEMLDQPDKRIGW